MYFQDEIENNMVTSLYLIIIGLRVAKGQASANQRPAIVAGAGIGIGVGIVSGGGNSSDQKPQYGEMETQIHHIVYR